MPRTRRSWRRCLSGYLSGAYADELDSTPRTNEKKHASQRTEGHRLDKQPQPLGPVVAGSSPAPRASKEADGRALAQLSRCSPPISATVHNAPHGVTVPALEGTSGERWHRSFWDACLPTSATGRPIADYRRRPPCVSNSEHEPGGRDPFRRGRRERSRRSRCRRSATIWSHRTLPFFAESTGGRSMDEIKGIARVKIHPGKLDEWKRLTEQAMEIVRTRDRGTLQYEVFFNDDESEAIVFERYRDADAALEHFANIGHLMEPLMATATVTGEVLATPNETMRAKLGDGEPKLFTPWMAAHD